MSAAAEVSDPAATFAAFVGELEAQNLPALRGRLCRDVCFVTPDWTAICGRERIDELFLTQLAGSRLQIGGDGSYCLELGDIALVSAKVRVRLPTDSESIERVSAGTFALAEREGTWKLLLIAPWGLPGNSQPFR